MRKQCVDTIRLKLIKIAAKVVKTGRYIYFKLDNKNVCLKIGNRK